MLVSFFPTQFITNAIQYLSIIGSIKYLKYLMVEILSMKDISKVQISRKNFFLRDFPVLCTSIFLC